MGGLMSLRADIGLLPVGRALMSSQHLFVIGMEVWTGALSSSRFSALPVVGTINAEIEENPINRTDASSDSRVVGSVAATATEGDRLR